MHLVRASPLKPGATSKASNSPAKSFPVTAATPIVLDDTHESRLCLRVKLCNPHPEQPFRTGELVEGHVHIFGPPGLSGSKPGLFPPLDVARLSLRIYFESRTTFWHLCPTNPDRQGKPSVIQRFEKILRHEVHRGVLPLTTLATSWPPDKALAIPFTETLLGRPHAALAFSFTLPRRMDITETNNCDGAPRGLCSFERCPPPSFRDSDGSVEWVIEAIMTLASGESPRIDERMLHLPTKDVVITRLVFPVLPARSDVTLLRDEPFFGDDLGADLLGARFRTIHTNSTLSERLGPRLSSLTKTWECYTKVFNLSLGSPVESELYVPSGAMVPQDAATFSVHLALRSLHTPSRSQIFGLLRKNRPIIARRARFSLHRSIYTRGGHEIKPHTSSVLVRQYDIDIDIGEMSNGVEPRDDATTPSGGLVNIMLSFDLQTDGTQLGGIAQPMIPVSTLIPSFRTPNIQLEYVLTLSLFFVGDAQEYHAARFPLQITPEDTIPINKLQDFPDSKLSLPCRK